MRVATQSAASLTAAVPSRLYSTPSKSKPLTGLRIAVEDLFDFRGIKTSGRNRALFEMSEPKSTTAAAVHKLIDAGAVIVRKKQIIRICLCRELPHRPYQLSSSIQPTWG